MCTILFFVLVFVFCAVVIIVVKVVSDFVLLDLISLRDRSKLRAPALIIARSFVPACIEDSS